jgi:hypothetical protein
MILRPMRLGEILDRAFHIYRSRFLMFLGIGALTGLGVLAMRVAGLILGVLLSQMTVPSSTKHAVAAAAMGISPFTWLSLCRFLAWPIFIVAASAELFGKRATLRTAMLECARRWRSWVVVGTVLWAIWNGVPALIEAVPILERAKMNAILSFSQGTVGEWPRSLFYYWLGWIVSLAVSPGLWMAVPVWTLEEIPVRKTLERVWALRRKTYGRIAITWFLTVLVEWVLAFTISFLVGMAMRISFLITGNEPVLMDVRERLLLLSGFTSAITMAPLFPIALTLIYYDQRIRQEGFDIEMMMHRAGMNTISDAPAEDAPVAAGESGEQPT